MTDLSHWDFAENFLGYDAAALILGLEPSNSYTEQQQIQVVTERMALHYTNVSERLKLGALGMDIAEQPDCASKRPIELISVELDNLHRRSWIDGDGPLTNWFFDKRHNSFDMQQFSRNEIARWLIAIGRKSVYPFEQKRPDVITSTAGRWPWGNHHTELLGHLEAAARKWWSFYEPSDSTTAPRNSDVSEWLQTERKVSRTMADSIASMLRPDGLPTGPRK
jgi:hypothetical protein